MPCAACSAAPRLAPLVPRPRPGASSQILQPALPQGPAGQIDVPGMATEVADLREINLSHAATTIRAAESDGVGDSSSRRKPGSSRSTRSRSALILASYHRRIALQRPRHVQANPGSGELVRVGEWRALQVRRRALTAACWRTPPRPDPVPEPDRRPARRGPRPLRRHRVHRIGQLRRCAWPPIRRR